LQRRGGKNNQTPNPIGPGDNIIDRQTQPFGMRRLERDGINLLLNGKPAMLRGTCELYYFPETWTLPLDIDSYREIIRRYKEIGFNWLRFHTTTPHEEFMQATDQLGMMIQIESPFGPRNDENKDQAWIDILQNCRKHPSVVIYCMGNEWFISYQRLEMIRRWAGFVKDYVPDGLFNPMEAMGGVEYGFTEEYGATEEDKRGMVEEPFQHNADKLKLLKEFSDVFGQGTSPYLSANSAGTGPEELEMLRKRLAVYERPCLSHEVGITGGYLNLDLEHRYVGTRQGTDLYASVRKNLKKAGLLKKASLYYRNACKLQSVIRKHNVENTRKLEYMKGYNYLGGLDPHLHRSGYPCGVVNEFYELKPGDSVEDILKYNGESVLLLDHSNYRNLLAGDKFSMKIMSSLYGFEKMTKGVLAWYAKDNHGRVHIRGQIDLENIHNGKIEQLGTIDFILPKIKEPVKLTIFAHLSGGEYEINNDWDFWVFPKPKFENLKAAADAEILARFGDCCPGFKLADALNGQLKVVTSLDIDTLRFLNNGGRVILFDAKQFPLKSTMFHPFLAGRPWQNRATVITDHPLMRQIPHEGFCDWQFYSMLEGGNAVVFNDINIPFEPILELVSTYKDILKQAGIFEFKVGSGNLLVCTLNIKKDDPAAMYLFEQMIRYALSNYFQPESIVTLTTLANIIDQNIESILE